MIAVIFIFQIFIQGFDSGGIFQEDIIKLVAIFISGIDDGISYIRFVRCRLVATECKTGEEQEGGVFHAIGVIGYFCQYKQVWGELQLLGVSTDDRNGIE